MHQLLSIRTHIAVLFITTLNENSSPTVLPRLFDRRYELLAAGDGLVGVVVFHCLSEFSRDGSALDAKSTHYTWFLLLLRVLLNVLHVVIVGSFLYRWELHLLTLN